jgi:ATP-binding cassette, subfamily B, bacterial
LSDFWRIIRFSRTLWPLYAAIGVLTVVVALLNQATPFLIKGIVDTVVNNLGATNGAVRPLVIFTLLILLAEVVVTLLDNLTGYIGDQVSVRLNRLLSEDYLQHLLNLPQSYFDNELSGRIINRLNRSISEITAFLQTFINNFVPMLLTAFITLLIIAYYSWPVAIMLALLFPLYFWLTRKSSEDWKAKQAKIIRNTEMAHGRFAEVIGQIRVVKSFVQERTERTVFKNQFDQILRTTKKQSRRWHIFDIYRRLALSVVVFLAYGYITYQVFQGSLSIGEFALLVQLITQVRWPLFGSSFLLEGLQRAEANSKDYFKVMAIEPAIKDRPGAKPLKVTSGEVKFSEVDFAYNQGETVVKDINFTIGRGQRVALIGQSGEGKSTIANLLLRLYEPSRGQIMIDGQDIGEITQASLRQNIGVVFQDPSLFSGSIRENISYAKPRASQAQIVAAAKAANADGFIKKLKDGYDTEIGERGIKLSGGQKQRIAIARAILKDPPILILDEATSSLDSKSEIEVQKALSRLMRGRTSLIIAHRLSTIKDVNTIVSLQNGRVAEVGSPAELARRGGLYAELLALQDPTKANKQKLKRYELVGR